jgi:hypothetical protein
VGTAGELANLLGKVTHTARTSLQYTGGQQNIRIESEELLGVAASLGYVPRCWYHVLTVPGEYFLTSHIQGFGRAIVRTVFHVHVCRVCVALAIPDAMAFVLGRCDLKYRSVVRFDGIQAEARMISSTFLSSRREGQGTARWWVEGKECIFPVSEYGNKETRSVMSARRKKCKDKRKRRPINDRKVGSSETVSHMLRVARLSVRSGH